MGLNEYNYQKFKEQLFGHLVKMAIGFVIGFLVIAMFEKDPNIVRRVGAGMLFAGMPYAWSVIPIKIFPTNILGLFVLICKFAIALSFGWIITAISFTYNLIQFVRYDGKLTDEKTKATAGYDEASDCRNIGEEEITVGSSSKGY